MYVFMFITGVIWTIAMLIIIVYLAGKITSLTERKRRTFK